MKKKTEKKVRKLKKLVSKGELLLMSCMMRCDVCGKKYLKTDFSKKIRTSMCFECDYWTNLVLHRPSNLYVINGVCYEVNNYCHIKDSRVLLGGKGVTRYLLTKDRKAIKTNDMWKIGTVPKSFREQLPDDAWLCPKNVYKRINRFDKQCNERSCLDRYKCFRFKVELELQNGPFNTIPDKWKTGNEHCRDFVNTDLLENYISPLKSNSNEKSN